MTTRGHHDATRRYLTGWKSNENWIENWCQMICTFFLLILEYDYRHVSHLWDSVSDHFWPKREGFVNFLWLQGKSHRNDTNCIQKFHYSTFNVDLMRVSEKSLSWKYLYKVNSTVQIKGYNKTKECNLCLPSVTLKLHLKIKNVQFLLRIFG